MQRTFLNPLFWEDKGSDAVPSKTKMADKVKYSYNGRHLYGEIGFCSNAFFRELLVKSDQGELNRRRGRLGFRTLCCNVFGLLKN